MLEGDVGEFGMRNSECEPKLVIQDEFRIEIETDARCMMRDARLREQ